MQSSGDQKPQLGQRTRAGMASVTLLFGILQLIHGFISCWQGLRPLSSDILTSRTKSHAAGFGQWILINEPLRTGAPAKSYLYSSTTGVEWCVKRCSKTFSVYCFKGICPEHFQIMTLAGLAQEASMRPWVLSPVPHKLGVLDTHL